MASCGLATGVFEAISRISIKETGISPGPPNLPIGFATNHSGFDCAMTMIASPAFASNSSALSAWKSYMTIPYTIAPFLIPILDTRALFTVVGVGVTLDADVSAYPESWSGLLVAPGDGRLVSELALSRSVRPRALKYETGTRPRASGKAGLHASYQSLSFSRPMT